MKKNVDNFYLSSVDLRFYFLLPQGRVRAFYVLLETIRYKLQAKVYLNYIHTQLCLGQYKQKKHKTEQIKKCLFILKDRGYIKRFSINASYVDIIFASVKKDDASNFMQPEYSHHLLDKIIDILGDDGKSVAYYKKIIDKVPEGLIIRSLEYVQYTVSNGSIKKSKAHCFSDTLRRECERNDIPFPFGNKLN